MWGRYSSRGWWKVGAVWLRTPVTPRRGDERGQTCDVVRRQRLELLVTAHRLQQRWNLRARHGQKHAQMLNLCGVYF